MVHFLLAVRKRKIKSDAADSIERILDQEMDQNEKHSELFKVK